MRRIVSLESNRWVIVSGKWQLSQGVAFLPYDATSYGDMNHRLLTYPVVTRDGEISASVILHSPTGQNAWLLARYRTPLAFYSAGIGGYEARAVINVQEERDSHPIRQTGQRSEISLDRLYRFRFTFEGDRLELFVDDASQGVVSHSQYIEGLVGLKVNGPGSVTFSDMRLIIEDSRLDTLVSCLKRFSQCMRRESYEPQNEDDVQRILWTMLRALYDDLEDEEVLQRIGLKQYRTDFGIPQLATIVEVKFLRESTDMKQLQEELMVDIQGYLSKPDSSYRNVVFFLYNYGGKLLDSRMTAYLRGLPSVLEVIEIPRSQPK